MTPIPFDASYTALLTAMGFEKEHHKEWWRDVGGPERGPKLVGHPPYDVWTKTFSSGTVYEIVVVDGNIVEMQVVPEHIPGLPF